MRTIAVAVFAATCVGGAAAPFLPALVRPAGCGCPAGAQLGRAMRLAPACCPTLWLRAQCACAAQHDLRLACRASGRCPFPLEPERLQDEEGEEAADLKDGSVRKTMVTKPARTPPATAQQPPHTECLMGPSPPGETDEWTHRAAALRVSALELHHKRTTTHSAAQSSLRSCSSYRKGAAHPKR